MHQQHLPEWRAIADGFGLPLAAIHETLYPLLWRRSSVRCHEVTKLYTASGLNLDQHHVRLRFHNGFSELWLDADGQALSTTARPPWPWLPPAEHLVLMRRAAVAHQHTERSTNWLYALTLCERELDAALADWLAGMTPYVRFCIESRLAPWGLAKDPADLLEQVEMSRTLPRELPDVVPWGDAFSDWLRPAHVVAALLQEEFRRRLAKADAEGLALEPGDRRLVEAAIAEADDIVSGKITPAA